MKKIVIVGAGHRCYTAFAKKLNEDFSDRIKIVGVCDVNVKRCEFYRDNLGSDIELFTDFDAMMDKLSPDAVIVTTVDRFHHEYIIKALKRGCDVYSEKPITIDEEKCFMIREAERESGKNVTVTFNCRFMPYFVRLKEIVKSGVIGKPLTINYEYVLNTVHGGDYFKRWHRFMANCGGMLVHKSTHHFDIVNWLLEDEPKTVSAQAARLYYGNDDRPHGDRCMQCDYKDKCESYAFLYDSDFLKKLYFDAEDVDGYIRDHCAFKNDTDIYDSMSVSVAYKKGTLLTYSLNLYSTEEGYTIHIIGEKGKIEASTLFEGDEYKIIVKYRDGRKDTITFPKAGGMHAGGDDRMFNMLFGGLKDDPLGQCAGSFDGFKSVMVGVAANKSIKEGRRVDVSETLDRLR